MIKVETLRSKYDVGDVVVLAYSDRLFPFVIRKVMLQFEYSESERFEQVQYEAINPKTKYVTIINDDDVVDYDKIEMLKDTLKVETCAT